MNQIYVAVRAVGKSRTVFGSAFGAEHDQNHIPHAIPAVSAGDDAYVDLEGHMTGHEFTSQELLELSAVPIPT